MLLVGLEKDVGEAIKWYTSAAKAGIKESEKELYRLKAYSSPGWSVIVALLLYMLHPNYETAQFMIVQFVKWSVCSDWEPGKNVRFKLIKSCLECFEKTTA